jgi:ribosome-binding protein aMBF1 (putative translation factor)
MSESVNLDPGATLTSTDRQPWDPPWRSREGQRHLPAELATALREGRRARGWSQRTAGERIGVTFTMISKLECGIRVPSTALAADLIEAYRLPAAVAADLIAVATSTAGRSSPYRTP